MTAAESSPTLVQAAGLALAVVVGVLGVLAPLSGVPWAAQAAGGVFLATVFLWLTEPLPYAVTAVLSVTLLFVLGLTDSFAAAVSGFASRLIFFLLLLFVLGGALSTVGLDERLAGRLLAASSGPRDTVRSLALNQFGLAILMPSAIARTVAFMPLVEQLGEAYGLDGESEFRRSAAIVLGHLNPMASIALMTGGGMPVITSELIAGAVREVTWVEWLVLMFPPVLAMYALSTLGVVRFGDIETNVQTPSGSLTTDGGDALTRDQRIVGAVMVGTMLAWVLGSFVGVPTIVPAVVAVTILALPPIGVVTADDFRDTAWGILFLIGAMFSHLRVLRETGALERFVDGVLGLVPLASLPPVLAILALLLVAAIIRLPFSTAPAAIIVIFPVVVEVGGALGFDRLYLGLSVLLVVASSTFLPFNMTTTLLQMNRSPLTFRDVFRYGLLTYASALVVLAGCWAVYWPLVT